MHVSTEIASIQTSFRTPWGIGYLSGDFTGLTSVDWGKPTAKKGSSDTTPWMGRLGRQIEAHLGGDLQSFRNVPVAWHLFTPFQRQVYQTLLKVKPGEVVTYQELARWMGAPKATRAVANALGANPCPIVIPCHRVVRTDGGLGGFSAPGGIETKRALLRIEGVFSREN